MILLNKLFKFTLLYLRVSFLNKILLNEKKLYLSSFNKLNKFLINKILSFLLLFFLKNIHVSTILFFHYNLNFICFLLNKNSNKCIRTSFNSSKSKRIRRRK